MTSRNSENITKRPESYDEYALRKTLVGKESRDYVKSLDASLIHANEKLTALMKTAKTLEKYEKVCKSRADSGRQSILAEFASADPRIFPKKQSISKPSSRKNQHRNDSYKTVVDPKLDNVSGSMKSPVEKKRITDLHEYNLKKPNDGRESGSTKLPLESKRKSDLQEYNLRQSNVGGARESIQKGRNSYSNEEPMYKDSCISHKKPHRCSRKDDHCCCYDADDENSTLTMMEMMRKNIKREKDETPSKSIQNAPKDVRKSNKSDHRCSVNRSNCNPSCESHLNPHEFTKRDFTCNPSCVSHFEKGKESDVPKRICACAEKYGKVRKSK